MAALWVVAYHLLLPGRLIGGWPAAIVGRGYLAVDVFFVLSGFVMALSYGELFSTVCRRRVLHFIRRRVARLYPLYGAILGTRLAYTGWRYGRFDLPRPWIAAPLPHPWTDIPANLLLVQSWGLAPSSIGPAWSISTEWGAYWVFPLIAIGMLHRGGRVALACGTVAVALLLATAVLLHSEGQPRLLDAWDGRTAGPLMRCWRCRPPTWRSTCCSRLWCSAWPAEGAAQPGCSRRRRRYGWVRCPTRYTCCTSSCCTRWTRQGRHHGWSCRRRLPICSLPA